VDFDPQVAHAARQLLELGLARVHRALDVLLQRIGAVELLAGDVRAVEAVEQRDRRAGPLRDRRRALHRRRVLRRGIRDRHQDVLEVQHGSSLRVARLHAPQH
jgi:hypothetical protein